MPINICTSGDDFVVQQNDRSQGGALTSVLTVNGSDGSVTLAPATGTTSVTGKLAVSGTATVNGSPALAGAPFKSFVALGHNGTGAITTTGTKVGDKVVMAANLTDDTDGAGAFETTVTVANQIQQSSATDLSAKKHLFLVVGQS